MCLNPTPAGRDPITKTASPERWSEIREKYPHFPEIKDVTAGRKEAFLRLPPSVEYWLVHKAKMVSDPRDVIMISTLFNMIITLVPIYGWLLAYPSHWVGFLGYATTYCMWAQRFMLMLHYAEHRNVFCHWLPKVVSAFFTLIPFGFPPGLYRLHHLVMHHVGNNIPGEDWSSTEQYQRDRPLHALMYVVSNWINIFTVPFYAIKKGRYDLVKISASSEVLWVVMGYACWKFTNPHFTLWAYIIPFFTTPSVLMVGNFWQHIFIHPRVTQFSPSEAQGYSYNAAIAYQSMNHFDNQYAFNDGYHLTHHVNSRVHWTSHVEHFLNNLENYVDGGALVFDGLGIADIGIYVFSGRLDLIADRLVQFTKEKKSKEEIIADLKIRLQPIKRIPQNDEKTGGKQSASNVDTKPESQSAKTWQAAKRKPL